MLIGLKSSGPHSNGYSLIRKVLEVSNADLTQEVDGKPLSEALLAPTRIYVKSILQLCKEMPVHAMAHITGGGLTENLPRVIPEGCRAVIDTKSWDIPEVFRFLQKGGNIAQSEMHLTFNCGVGMILCVAAEHGEKAVQRLTGLGEEAFVIGHMKTGEGEQVVYR